MSSRPVHSIVGIGAGAAAAAFSSTGLDEWKRATELLGGAIGGYLGSRMPDILEPATSPNHRRTAHAVLPMGTCFRLAVGEIDDLQALLREKARSLLEGSATANGPRALDQLLALLLHLFAGAIAGFVAGYISHLVLDATTPKGLPLM